MSPRAISAQKRLRLAAVVVVLVLAAGVGYDIKSAPPTYLESATVIFTMPKFWAAPYTYSWLAPSVIASGEAMTQILMSPQSQHRIREAGGTARYDLVLINLYNEDHPNYSRPLASLTAGSPSAADAHRTFIAAARLLRHLLAARQAQAGVAPRNRISAQIIGDTGPIVQAGSPKRAFAGLALVAVVAVSMLWGFLGRRVGGRNPAVARYPSHGVPSHGDDRSPAVR
jgi:hypothetical protein